MKVLDILEIASNPLPDSYAWILIAGLSGFMDACTAHTSNTVAVLRAQAVPAWTMAKTMKTLH